MPSNGVDVSNFNAGLELKSLSGLDFAIAKVTEGTTFIDSTFNEFASQAKAMAIGHFGGYHFFHAENLNARAQAEFFCKHVVPRSGWSLWVDYETFGVSGQVDAEEIGFFIDEVKAEYPHAKVGIYTNGVGLSRIRPYLPEIGFTGLWYAAPSIPMTEQIEPLPWLIHQYEELNGIDRDYCTLSVAELRSLFTWPA